MTIYKIRDKKTGLFSTGGIYAVWNDKGQSYTTPAKAVESIKMNQKSYHPDYLNKTLEVVEFTLKESDIIVTLIPKKNKLKIK